MLRWAVGAATMRAGTIGVAVALLIATQGRSEEPNRATGPNAAAVLAKLDATFVCPEAYPSRYAYRVGMGRFALDLSAISLDGQITQRQIADARNGMLRHHHCKKTFYDPN